MNALLRVVLMVVVLAGLQGMAVDLTCMLLWHTAPLAESGVDAAHNHHPDSPKSHQGDGDGATLFGDYGSMLPDHSDMPSLALLPPAPQTSRRQPVETLVCQLEPSWLDKSDPPKPTVFV